MPKEVATTKWCPVCNSSQKIKGFRSFYCYDCWKAGGKPKIEPLFKAMDKPKGKK
jgi:tRNA(Ile2) C34 agmatinyltransferase TiaS